MFKIDVLGQPAEDNALLITADNGNGLTRLLLDCGESTLQKVPFSDVQAIDHLLFSHLHMDHVAGFDSFFRMNFERVNKENHIWGPPETARIMAHRFRGYWWNYAQDLQASWLVHEIHADEIQTFRFEGQEAFEIAHPLESKPREEFLFKTPQVEVQAIDLQHQGPCLGFITREPQRSNINTAAMKALELKGGPWLAQLKAGVSGPLEIDGKEYDADTLREQLVEYSPGQSAAYLTDFLLDETELKRLTPLLSNVQNLYAEAQYAPQDIELATRHHHTTVEQVALLAKQAQVQKLTLLHLSRRYSPGQWPELLQAARKVFKETGFPAGWE